MGAPVECDASFNDSMTKSNDSSAFIVTILGKRPYLYYVKTSTFFRRLLRVQKSFACASNLRITLKMYQRFFKGAFEVRQNGFIDVSQEFLMDAIKVAYNCYKCLRGTSKVIGKCFRGASKVL